MHVIPYLESKTTDYEDKLKLLRTDQRDIWWQRYGIACGKDYAAMPAELRHEEFEGVTAQPLLNYLMAIAIGTGVDIGPDTNINSVYEHLICSVFRRPWADKQHPALEHFSREAEFLLILQEIAVAVWHGNGRAATRTEILSRCQNGTLKHMFESLRLAAVDGVTRLLTAFYFRRFDDLGRDEPAFEFSHKSFGEYLTSRHIVARMRVTTQERQRNRSTYSGWKEELCLKNWVELCGPKAMDKDLFKFIS